MGKRYKDKDVFEKKMNEYMVDTTVVVDMLRGDKHAKAFLEKFPEISIVTVAEIIQGCRDKVALRIVERTCEILQQIKINGEISYLAIDLLKKYHLSHGLLFLDALIAATCITRKNILVTENLKDFRFIADLQLLSQKEAFAKL